MGITKEYLGVSFIAVSVQKSAFQPFNQKFLFPHTRWLLYERGSAPNFAF
jgi:hypothetical protein